MVSPFSMTGHGKRSSAGVDDNTTLGCVCGTTGKAFYLEMGMKVAWSHEREVVPGYPGESLSLRCVSDDGHLGMV